MSKPAASVVALHRIAARHGTPEPTDIVTVVTNFGVEGDHHARAGRSRQVVIVEAEVLDDLGVQPGQTREQLTVRGLRDGGAVDAPTVLRNGAVLEIGTVRLEIDRPRVPCTVMDEVRPGLERELRGRGGWCARVLAGGTIRRGDRISVGYVSDHASVTELRSVMAAWEASSVEAREGRGLSQQLPTLIDALRSASVKILGSETAHELSAMPAASIQKSSLWDQHDAWSTVVVDAARKDPGAAEQTLVELADTYRSMFEPVAAR
jgi:MOSC domain-containing protein YiiM